MYKLLEPTFFIVSVCPSSALITGEAMLAAVAVLADEAVLAGGAMPKG